jgi:hypothetical protein
VAFEVRECFLTRREAEPEDVWSSYEVAQAILILMGSNQSFRPVLVAGCLYDRVAPAWAVNMGFHNITISLASANPDTT